MFVNCPFCRGLVATDPVTDQPPERCPRCSAALREASGTETSAGEAGRDARSGVAEALAEAFGAGADEARERNAGTAPPPQPVISIANLLQPGPATVVPASPPPVAVTASPHTQTATPESAPPPPTTAAEERVRAADRAQVVARTAGAPVAPVASGADVAAAVDVAPADPAGGGAAAAAGTPGADTAARPGSPAASPDVPARARRVAPSFARTRRAPAVATASGRRWPLPAAIGALTVLLALQWLLADRARLAADPSWRPVVVAACGLLRCSLPPWREPTAFALLERDVRPHPETAGALRITASFRNDAAWAQPWPEVVLTLSDIDDRPLGTRAFQPAEYLGSAPSTGLVEAGDGAVIRMDVLEPGPGAVGFSFDFR